MTLNIFCFWVIRFKLLSTENPQALSIQIIRGMASPIENFHEQLHKLSNR